MTPARGKRRVRKVSQGLPRRGLVARAPRGKPAPLPLLLGSLLHLPELVANLVLIPRGLLEVRRHPGLGRLRHDRVLIRFPTVAKGEPAARGFVVLGRLCAPRPVPVSVCVLLSGRGSRYWLLLRPFENTWPVGGSSELGCPCDPRLVMRPRARVDGQLRHPSRGFKPFRFANNNSKANQNQKRAGNGQRSGHFVAQALLEGKPKDGCRLRKGAHQFSFRAELSCLCGGSEVVRQSCRTPLLTSRPPRCLKALNEQPWTKFSSSSLVSMTLHFGRSSLLSTSTTSRQVSAMFRHHLKRPIG